MKKLSSRPESTIFKILSLAGLAVLAFCLSVCSNPSGGGSDNDEPPAITTTALPGGIVGTEYSETLLEATGTAPITWTLDSGDLPDGLILASNGTISGTPVSDGTFDFTVKAGNSAGSDTKELSIFIYEPGIITITGSGTTFTATKNGSTVGTAGQSIQAVIDDIKIHTAGVNCEIQFGDGGILDIGTAYVDFDGGTGGSDWGIITLMGKISSTNSDYTSGTILLQNNVSINVEAEIANTVSYSSSSAIYNASTGTVNIIGSTVSATAGRAISNYSTGKVNISGSTVSATTSNAIYNASSGEVNIKDGTVSATINIAIYNASSGEVNISGGTIEATTSSAIWNNSTGTINISGGSIETTSGNAVFNTSIGTVNISGGAIEATTGSAIWNNSNGKITVSEATPAIPTLISSANTGVGYGTIHLYVNGIGGERLEITGGRVENTSSGSAIWNNSTGTVNISGGTVSTTTGTAVHNQTTGEVNISGGTVSTTTSTVVYNQTTGEVNISGGTVSTTTGTVVYNQTTGEVNISGGTVKATTTGRAISNNTGKVNISGGTVSATTSSAIWNNSTGTINISGGSIETTSGNAVYNSIGTVNISDGTIEATEGEAVYNISTGEVNISGGTVSATTGRAIHNYSTGKITISETIPAIPTLISSANTGTSDGTIYLNNNDTGGVRLEVTGGTVENTAGSSYFAVYNASSGTATVKIPPTVIIGQTYGVTETP